MLALSLATSLLALQPAVDDADAATTAVKSSVRRNSSGAGRESDEILSIEKSAAIRAGLGAMAPMDNGQLECRRSRSKGSRFLEKRICKTAREWEAERREYAAITREQRGGRGVPQPGG